MSQQKSKFPRAALARVALLSLFVTSLVACGDYEDTSSLAGARGDVVSPKLRPFVDEFLRLFGSPLPEMPISLGMLPKEKAGVCIVPPNDSSMLGSMVDGVLGDSATRERHIVININFFKSHQGDPDRIQQVVFHEMGHCYLERGHDRAMMATEFGSVPESIMYPMAFGGGVYTQYYRHYVDELFGRIGAAPLPSAPGGVQTNEAPEFGDCVMRQDEDLPAGESGGADRSRTDA